MTKVLSNSSFAWQDPLNYFAGSLIHELRNSLSVIMNELSFLSTRCPNEDFERAQRRSQGISTLLQEISHLLVSPAEFRKITLLELVDALRQAKFSPRLYGNIRPESAIHGQLRALVQGFNCLLAACRDTDGAESHGRGSGGAESHGVVLEIDIGISGIELRIVCPFEFPSGLILGSEGSDSFSRLFAVSGKSKGFYGPLLDALFAAHRCAVRLSLDSGLDGGLKVLMRFPAA